jgi:hypothetical protein
MPNPPKDPSVRRGRNGVVTEWKKAEQVGWRHGSTPKPPAGVTPAARKTWALWFSAWWASFWELEDVPNLELALRLWDEANARPERVTKYEPLAKQLGLTPKGRFDLRWQPPLAEQADEKPDAPSTPATPRLRVVDAG